MGKLLLCSHVWVYSVGKEKAPLNQNFSNSCSLCVVFCKEQRVQIPAGEDEQPGDHVQYGDGEAAERRGEASDE